MNRIRVAHEAPISLLQRVQEVTDYDYALVHLFETHPQYFEFFKQSRQQGRDILLDNSLFELGVAFDSAKFVQWIEKLQPSYFVVPDVLESGADTVSSFITFIDEYTDLPSMHIGTVQGKNYAEIVECYRFMSDHADMIALSFDLSYYMGSALGDTKLQRQMNGRIKLVNDLIHDGIWNFNKPTHLLGAALSREFSYYTQHGIEIYSCDTSNPVMAGLKGLRYSSKFGIQTKPTQKLVELIDHNVTNDEWDLIKFNIDNFRLNLSHA